MSRAPTIEDTCPMRPLVIALAMVYGLTAPRICVPRWVTPQGDLREHPSLARFNLPKVAP